MGGEAEMDGRICPYCRFPVLDGGGTVVCPSCDTAHHRECWEENGGCARFGCPHSPGMRAQNPLVVEISPPARGSTGREELVAVCPNCLQPIPARSRACPWCRREISGAASRYWWERSPWATLGAVVLSILITVGLILLIVKLLSP